MFLQAGSPDRIQRHTAGLQDPKGPQFDLQVLTSQEHVTMWRWVVDLVDPDARPSALRPPDRQAASKGAYVTFNIPVLGANVQACVIVLGERLRNPVRHRLDLPVRARAAELQRAAHPGGVPDDEAAALLVVEDEQREPVGVDRAELLPGQLELAGGQDHGAARGEERAE